MGWESEGVGYLGICSTTVGLCRSHVFVVQTLYVVPVAVCHSQLVLPLAGRTGTTGCCEVIHICNLQQVQHMYNRNSNTNSNPCCNELDVKSLTDIIIIMKFTFGSSMYVCMYVRYVTI